MYPMFKSGNNSPVENAFPIRPIINTNPMRVNNNPPITLNILLKNVEPSLFISLSFCSHYMTKN